MKSHRTSWVQSLLFAKASSETALMKRPGKSSSTEYEYAFNVEWMLPTRWAV